MPATKPCLTRFARARCVSLLALAASGMPAAVWAGNYWQPLCPDGAVCATSTRTFAANGRALTLEAGEAGGFVRVVSLRDGSAILGIQAVGRHVAELAGEFAHALAMGAMLDDLAHTIHVHPTLGATMDIFVAGYASNGTYSWARVIGSDSDEAGKGVATDSSGNVLVTGYQGSYLVDYGGGPQTNRGGNDIFMAKYSSAGSWVWSKTVGGFGYDQGNAITADGSGNVFVTGYIGSGSVGADFGGGELFSAGLSDVFLVKYSPTGAHIWSQRFGGAGNDVGMALATDAAGNVYVVGSFEQSVNFGGGSFTKPPITSSCTVACRRRSCPSPRAA